MSMPSNVCSTGVHAALLVTGVGRGRAVEVGSGAGVHAPAASRKMLTKMSMQNSFERVMLKPIYNSVALAGYILSSLGAQVYLIWYAL